MDAACVSEEFMIFSKRGHTQLFVNTSVEISQASRLDAGNSISHGA